MATTTFGDYDAWQRHALISIDDGTTAYNMHALTETIDIDQGERELDLLNLLNLGQIPKHGGHGLTTVTFEGYALEAGSISAGGASVAATGFWDIFAEIPRKDTSEPIQVSISNEVTRYRVAILWTNDGTATAGSSAVASSSTNLGVRYVIADCYCTSHKLDFTDGILKTTLTFKGPAFNKAAEARIKMESIDTTASALSALSSYTPGASTPW